MFGKGWVYTEDFFKGLMDDAKDEMQSVEKHPLDAMVDSNPALANSSLAIDAAAQFAMDSWQSGDKAAILNYYQKQQADAKAQLYLGRLMTDPKCRELLYNFPKRYVQADSSTDAATMLGRFAPLLILALVTKGRSTELETSTELKTIIESIAGDKGTIERAAVQTMDEGDVESKSSKVVTIRAAQIFEPDPDRVYIPNKELPRDVRTRQPTPSSSKPHTQLGYKQSRKGFKYRQAREWGYNEKGKLVPKRDIDFTDHGRGGIHMNPHQHKYIENETGGTLKRGKEEPLS